MTRRQPRAVEEVSGPGVGIAFGTPPPERAPSYDWAAIAKKLKRKPGQWLLVFREDRQTLATALREGKMTALKPEKGFEVRTANNNIKVKPRTCTLWLRYNPENDTTKEASD